MKKIWDEIGVFPLTGQRLADQARQIRTKKWFIDIDIEEKKRNQTKKISNVGNQENDQELIEHNKNKQGQSEEELAQHCIKNENFH